MANHDEIHELDEQEAAPAAPVAPAVDSLRQENTDGSVVLTLRFPKTVQYRSNGTEREEYIEQLNIRRTNGGDLRMVMRLQKDEEKCVIGLFKNLTAQPEPVFDKLDGEDLLRFFKEIEHFLPDSQKIGKK